MPSHTLELVNLRASQINGCSLCVEMHSRDLRKPGEPDERLLAVAAWREAPYFTDAERAALALTAAHFALPKRVWTELREHERIDYHPVLLSRCITGSRARPHLARRARAPVLPARQVHFRKVVDDPRVERSERPCQRSA